MSACVFLPRISLGTGLSGQQQTVQYRVGMNEGSDETDALLIFLNEEQSAKFYFLNVMLTLRP